MKGEGEKGQGGIGRRDEGVSRVIQHGMANGCYEGVWLVSSFTMLDTTFICSVLITACAIAVAIGLRSLKQK